MGKIVFLLFIVLFSSMVSAQEALFDIQITIPDDYKIIYPGDELLTSIRLVNLGSEGRVDVFLDYWITDSEQNVILKKKETVAVETQANFVRTFDISKNIKPGKYHLYAKITYADGREAVAEHSFDVIKKQIDKRIYYITGIILVVLLFLLSLRKLKSFLKKMMIKEKVYAIVKKRER